MKASKSKLPKEVIDDLDRNTLFNRFGLVNIKAVKSRTGCEIDDEELKILIQKQFGHEMSNGEVEFIK